MARVELLSLPLSILEAVLRDIVSVPVTLELHTRWLCVVPSDSGDLTHQPPMPTADVMRHLRKWRPCLSAMTIEEKEERIKVRFRHPGIRQLARVGSTSRACARALANIMGRDWQLTSSNYDEWEDRILVDNIKYSWEYRRVHRTCLPLLVLRRGVPDHLSRMLGFEGFVERRVGCERDRAACVEALDQCRGKNVICPSQ